MMRVRIYYIYVSATRPFLNSKVSKSGDQQFLRVILKLQSCERVGRVSPLIFMEMHFVSNVPTTLKAFVPFLPLFIFDETHLFHGQLSFFAIRPTLLPFQRI